MCWTRSHQNQLTSTIMTLWPVPCMAHTHLHLSPPPPRRQGLPRQGLPVPQRQVRGAGVPVRRRWRLRRRQRRAEVRGARLRAARVSLQRLWVHPGAVGLRRRRRLQGQVGRVDGALQPPHRAAEAALPAGELPVRQRRVRPPQLEVRRRRRLQGQVRRGQLP